MHDSVEGMLRQQLSVRRQQLGEALADTAAKPQIRSLLAEVDEALARMDAGRFGLCEACHDPIETDRLLANPLVRLCLDHLTRAQASALERDLELARSVQQGILPSSPYESGPWRMAYQYRPAGIVSGDYCDVVAGRLGDRYFLLGDVAGKGVAASMLMTQMHGMFRALIPAGLPLGQLVERASTLFCESTLPSHYATLAVVRALDDGSVEICNAGHVTPMAVQQGHVVPLQTGSLPLGMFCAVDFPVTRVPLAAGDAVVLVTDGITEAENAAGAEFGTDRLARVCAGSAGKRAEHVVAAVLDEVDDYRSGPLGDDATVMVVTRT
jgi:sigma-B regulation protein RsbU (phosphoserine phosphatase)